MKEARVIQEHKTNYVISDGGKEFVGTVRGNFFAKDVLFPKVGDMVVYEELDEDKATIEEVLPRISTISRKAIGSDAEQVIVTNVDLICIVMGLDGDFNPSRLDRYMQLAT
ncbi:ribosome small subunit-dependent GTPase, partial [Patescibacteria group bacterium]|nr:ribosome small subunit-dependent GTPase [Patescibacteria group bacterium]